MTDWVQDVPREEMIQPEDIAEAVRFLLRTSPACIVPEIRFVRPGDSLWSDQLTPESSRSRAPRRPARAATAASYSS